MKTLSENEQSRLAYASFLVEESKLLFVETPKAACSSMKHAMAALSGADFDALSTSLMASKSHAMGIHDRSTIAVPSFNDVSASKQAAILKDSSYLRFCVVRNPFVRLASAWADRLLCHSISPLAPVVEALGFPDYRPDRAYLREAFCEFVDHLYKKEAPYFSNHHWQPMEQVLMPEVIGYNLVIRTEEMGAGLAKLASHVEQNDCIWPGLPRLNENPIKLGLELYNQASVRKVAAMYEDDFVRYGYSPRPDTASVKANKLPSAAFIIEVQQRNRRIFELSLKARGIT